MAKIISTMSNDQNYTFYKRGSNNNWLVDKTIHVKGKANVADKYLITRDFSETIITDEEADMLLGRNGHPGNPDFKNHVKRGHLKVADYMDASNAGDLEKKDKSAPLTPADYEGKEGAAEKPRVSKPKTKKEAA